MNDPAPRHGVGVVSDTRFAGKSREHVRHTEVRAFEKIQRSIHNSAIEERLTTG